jgi:molybdopterin converting factor subunit 1
MAERVIQVRLFAALREAAKTDRICVALPTDGTVATLRAELCRRWPHLQQLVQNSAIAVNHQYASEQQTLSPSDDVALIPPVSGG